MNQGILLGVFFLATATTQAQQIPIPDPSESAPRPPGYFEVQAALEDFRAERGDGWILRYEDRTQAGRFLFGGSAQPSFRPKADEDYFVLAREFLAETHGMHRVDPSTLVEDSVTFLPLGALGSSDKLTVRLVQEVRGVPVLGGSVNVLFDTQGRLLSIDVQALPSLAGFSTLPAYGEPEARDAAAARFRAEAGVEPTFVGRGQLAIAMSQEGKHFQPRLVWDVNAQWQVEGFTEQGWHYRLDAYSGEVVQREASIHHLDVSGRVTSQVSPGTSPDNGSNAVNDDMPYMTVSSPQGNTVTDVNGNFTIAGATAPLNVTVTYQGTYAATDDTTGPDYSLTTALNSATGNVITMNPGEGEADTAEANAFLWIGLMREWTRSVNPADNTSDFLAPANVMLNSTCNAYYDGVSVNFYAAGGGCVNSAYSSVVLHEMGHWLNDRYGSGNGSDGFGEGNADVFSMYILEDPIVGKNFCGTGCHIRDANNANTYCGSGCYGQVHADGEVLMGALWGVRENLKSSLGVAAGMAYCNTLFNGWMNAYDDGNISPLIEDHWLTLDDDDGNIANGTPNFDAIDDGFTDQGFPGFELTFVGFANVSEPGDTLDEVGPYQVSADLTVPINPPLGTATLFYRVNGGFFSSVAMTPSGGGTYTAGIPGQASPAKVEWYLLATDSTASGNKYPKPAPVQLAGFDVGSKQTFLFQNFESGTAGWTHGLISNQDDWQRSAEVGAPSGSFGKAGDPTSAYSGTQIWGNDLGGPGWNGFYMDDTNNWLRSPVIDLSAAVNAKLRFQRWLTVEDAVYDQARVRVGGTQVWINQTGANTIDTAWTEVEIDISAFDGNPGVIIEFSMVSDGGVTFGGWNLDDVEVITIGPSSNGGSVNYCTPGISSSGCLASIDTTGTASATANSGFTLFATGVEGSKDGVFYWGVNGRQANPWGNGTSLQCVVPPVKRGGLLKGVGTNLACNGAFSQNLNAMWCPTCPKPWKNPGAGALVDAQLWFRDPGNTSNQKTSFSNAVEFVVGP